MGLLQQPCLVLELTLKQSLYWESAIPLHTYSIRPFTLHYGPEACRTFYAAELPPKHGISISGMNPNCLYAGLEA